MFFYRKRFNKNEAEKRQESGLSALVSMQKPDGSFPVYQRVRFKPWWECHPLFSTTSVLLAVADLLPLDNISRAIGFVLDSRRKDQTWEYAPDFGIPADSDDTACSLAVLARYDKNLVKASDVDLLRSFWRSDGGPFQTWKASGYWSNRDRDDAVVNCNILLALKELGSQPTDDEKEAVYRLINNNRNGTRYYCSPLTIGYAAQRAGLDIDTLPSQVTNRPKSKRLVLPMAQWLSIFQQWDADMVANILAAQSHDGHWLAENWFRAVGKPPPVWGSPAISTALCIEALHKVSKTIKSGDCNS